MRKSLGLLVGAGILLALVYIGWQMSNKNGDVNTTVIEQINKVAKLQTIEMKLATILEKSKKDWAGAKKYTVYFAEGTVLATIDLNEMTIDHDEVNDIVKIKLPPKVGVSNPTNDGFRTVCTHGTLTAPNFTDNERSKHNKEAFAIIKRRAIGAGIEKMAVEQAKEYLSTFIGALGLKVEFI